MKCSKQLVLLVLSILFIIGINANSYALTISTQDAQAIIETQLNKCYGITQGSLNTTNYNLQAQTSRIVDTTSLATTLNEIISYYETTYNYTLDYDDISILWLGRANSDYAVHGFVYITSTASDFPTGNLWLRVDDYTSTNNKFYLYNDNTNKYPFYWEIRVNKTTGIVTKASNRGDEVASQYYNRYSSSYTSNNSGETWQKTPNKTISGDKYYWGAYVSLSPAQYVADTNANHGNGEVTYILNGNNAGLLSPTPSGDTPSGDTPSGDTPSGDTPSGDTPSGDTPSGDTQSGESFAGYWGNSDDLSGETQQAEIEETINEITENISGEIASGEALQGITQLQDNLINTLNYGKENPQLLDLIIKWNDIKYNNQTIIPSGEINFSKMCRDNETLETIQMYVRTIACFQIAWALIIQIYNLTLATLGIDNPYLYENEDNINTTTFEDEFGNGYEDTIIRDRRGNKEIYRQSVTRAKPGRQIGFRKD